MIAIPSVIVRWQSRSSHGRRPAIAEVVDGMAELVEHRVGPARIVADVREHTDVAAADRRRGRTRAGTSPHGGRGRCARAPHRPAARMPENVSRRRARRRRDRRRADRDRCRPRPGRPGRTGRRSATGGGRPGVQSNRSASRASSAVLPACRTGRASPLAGVERLEQPRLVHLLHFEREREPVAVAEAAGDLVSDPRKLPDVVRDSCPDRLRRLPCLASLGLVVAAPEQLEDLVVVDLDATDDATMLREPRLDARLERHEPVAELLGRLVRRGHAVEEVELPADRARRRHPRGPRRSRRRTPDRPAHPRPRRRQRLGQPRSRRSRGRSPPTRRSPRRGRAVAAALRRPRRGRWLDPRKERSRRIRRWARMRIASPPPTPR